jgi:hypothetical protein
MDFGLPSVPSTREAVKEPAEAIEMFCSYNFIETVAKAAGQGAASCCTCGHGETCQVGSPTRPHGPRVKITPDMIPDVPRQPGVMDAAAAAGREVGRRLREGP